ncbi:hypothetical protein Droror1_Dr00000137 [Drosera rotundifolia]
MFHFERGKDPDLVVQVRSYKYTTLHEMVEQAVRIEDAIIAAKGLSQKRTRDEPVREIGLLVRGISSPGRKRVVPEKRRVRRGTGVRKRSAFSDEKEVTELHPRTELCPCAELTFSLGLGQGPLSLRTISTIWVGQS